MSQRVLFIAVLLLGSAAAQSQPQWREWNRPVEPFRIIGNIYYVGAANVSSFAIKTSKGVVILDGGFEETAPQILSNLQKLGIDARDVKILLNSHAHGDHAGGLRALKQATGAPLYASAGDRDELQSGGHDDFAFGNSLLFPAVKVDRVIADGEHISLGGVDLVAHLTPGHTKGCTTWTTPVHEGGAAYNVVFTCSLSAPGYRLVNNAKYPNIVEDFESTFRTLSSLKADVLLSPHGDIFQLSDRYKRLKAGDAKAFVDPAAYTHYLKEAREEFEKKVQDQRAAAD